MPVYKKEYDYSPEIHESSKLFTLKNWTSKAVPMSEVFAVLGDMLEDGDSVLDKTFDV